MLRKNHLNERKNVNHLNESRAYARLMGSFSSAPFEAWHYSNPEKNVQQIESGNRQQQMI